MFKLKSTLWKLSAALGLILMAAFCFRFFDNQSRHPNIIIILVDTLRADHLGFYGYQRNTSPNLDLLAAESLVFDRAFSTASWTPPATTSILTGLYPSSHTNQPPKRLSTAVQLGNKIPEKIRLLPELLKQKNYQTAALSSNPWITREFGLDRGFDVFYYSKHMNAEKLLERSRKTVARFLEKRDQPFFLYLHLIDPHDPYTAHPEFPFEGQLKGYDYSAEVTEKINAYDSEIRFTDYHIGEFLQHLKMLGVYEETILIFTSDHGEAFDEHGVTGHGFNLHVEEVKIPLLVRGLTKHERIADAVSQVDIVPTILDLLDIDAPYELAGVRLTDKPAIKARNGVFSETYRIFRQRAFSARAGERLIMQMGDIENPQESMSLKGLYDLNTDPYEKNSLNDPLIMNELKGYLDSAIRRNLPLAAPQEVQIKKGTMEQLQSLGYIN